MSDLTSTQDISSVTAMPADGHPERVVLFDIDGTLLRAARRGEYRRLTREMLVRLFGTCGRINEVDFAGKTDLAIYREALECAGITLDQIRDQLHILEAAKIDVLNELARDGDVFHLCPGAQPLLEAMSQDSRLLPCLLTGNFERLAEVKLEMVGLMRFFRVRGAFGSDDDNRDNLPALAAQRVCEYIGSPLPPDRFVVVGDTPRDIWCARHFGARVVAVASGVFTLDQLKEYSPDAVLEDLSNTEQVLELLTVV